MKSRLEKVLDKMPNKKVDLKAHKVDLSLVDDINNELDSFEQAESEASYLAYEWGDEIMDAYSELSLKYNIDDYIVNGSTTMLGEYGENIADKLNKIQDAAEELGIDPNAIYDGFYELSARVEDSIRLEQDAKAKYREIISWVGLNDFWR